MEPDEAPGLTPLNDRAPKKVLFPLFLASATTLYLEILLIRWVGTEVRIFAFFQNLALIACFLGFGLGCYRAGRPSNGLLGLVGMTGLITLAELPVKRWQNLLANLSNLLSLWPDAALWGFSWDQEPATLLMLQFLSVLLVGVLLWLLAASLIPSGQWVGYYLDRAPNPISAYSANLVGSVVGLWVFAGLAFLWLPPAYWFGVAFLLFLWMQRPSWRFTAVAVLLLAVSLLLLSFPETPVGKTYWSPYQKLRVLNVGEDQYQIAVNNTGYMMIANTTPEFLQRHPGIAEHYRAKSSYDAPFRFAQSVERVLIVGAGAGNDAAGALRNGATRVDAVEIDPVIYALGEQLHPDRPYSSPRVRRIIEDARAFFRRSTDKYDVILFGLLDSHTQFSDYSNVRIDNYVYTTQAIQDARRLLTPHGILVVKFEVREPWTWMGRRFYSMLEDVFGREPLVFHAPQFGQMISATVFVTSDDDGLWERAAQRDLATILAQQPPRFPLAASSPPPVIPTDDWPYVYHVGRSIPRTYLTVSLILLGLAVLLVGQSVNPRQVATWHFFLLGAGFLLLETQMISRLALYFGTTWMVNCVALTAILLMLLLANVYVARRSSVKLGTYYSLLVIGLVGNYVFPWSSLPFQARTVGILLCLAYSLAVFSAGVVFVEAFRRSRHRSAAFGANIIGAVAGGLAQNISFITGLKSLLLLAAAVYLGAAVSGWLAGATEQCWEAAPEDGGP